MDSNSSNFMLIDGHSIIREPSIKEVAPEFTETLSLNVMPPVNPGDEFTFVLDLDTEISLRISRTDPDDLAITPPNFTRVVKDTEVLSFEDIVEGFFDKEKKKDRSDIERITTRIDNYKKRIRKIAKYHEKVMALNANPTDPNYVSNLSAISADAPSAEDDKKQTERLEYIHKELLERIVSVYEAENPEEDSEEDSEDEVAVNPILARFNNADSAEHVENTVTKLLREFYEVNILGNRSGAVNDNDDYDMEDETSDTVDLYGHYTQEELEEVLTPEEVAAEMERREEHRLQLETMHTEAVENAQRILDSGNAITNGDAVDDEDQSETSDETIAEDDPDQEADEDEEAEETNE